MENETETLLPVGSDDLVVPLRDALALVDFGPCKTADRPQDWMNVASPMCAHCEGVEDVNLAAARIIAAEYRVAADKVARLQALHDCMDPKGFFARKIEAILRHNA
jgi:hypothetical protein